MNNIDQSQVIKILGLTQELCSIQSAFIYLRKDNNDCLITANDSYPKAFDNFYVLYKQVLSRGIEIKKDHLDQELSSFIGMPILNARNEVVAALCLVNHVAFELNKFQSENLNLYRDNLSSCFRPNENIAQWNKSNFDLLHICTPYFLALDMELRIVEVGLNFYKSIPNIINGKSLFDYFFLDRKDAINQDKVNDQWFNRMHFLDLKDGLQRYKCSIRELNGLFYLWASPIVNAKFALKNYHVTVNDFPNHDTIAEYLFLEQTSRKSLIESREITNNLLSKNREVTRIQKEMKAIAKFPGENPNPILRFDLDLNLVYHNPSAEKSFLSDFGIDDGKINNEEVRKVILKIIKDNEPYKQLFIEGDKHYYSINTALIADMGYLNIYAHDITEYQYRSKENESALRQLNEKIESQREFYEFILNNLPADVAVFNKDHQYVFINPKGIEDDKVRAYMIGKDDYDYCKLKGISSDMADGRRALFKRILESKENETWVDDLIDRHGNRNVIHRSMGPLFDENGEIRMVIGYGTEITQRVIAEEENVKLSLVAKNTNNGVLMLNKEMRITWANQAMIDRSGYSLKEMLGKNPREFISSNERSPEMSQIQEAAVEKKNIEVEVMQRSKEGISYYVALNFQPLYDAVNNHSGYMMVEFDITDRIRNESTIRNLNVNLERLVQEKTAKNMELASSLRDQEKMVTIGELASGVAHDLNTPLGAIKSGTDNVSYTLDVLFKKVLPQCTSDEIQYAFSRTMATTFELFVGGVQMKREKDQFLTLISTLSASVKESELDEIAMLLVKNRLDISDEEEVLFILNSRNPLLLLNLMYHVHLVFSFIKTIANSGSRASQVVQNLRLFIREKRNTESGTVNIKNNIETVLNIFSHKIQNQVDLTVDIDDNLHIKGFDVRLFQLWSNLIKNSLECMEDQKEKVLKLYSEVSPSVFTIIVENNGPEIKGELKRKIFNKFFTTKGSRNGSGMGLSIVKNVLEEHQGRIDVKSDEKATRFVIQFNRF